MVWFNILLKFMSERIQLQSRQNKPLSLKAPSEAQIQDTFSNEFPIK